MSETIEATLYTDPACPWGYSALPALSVLDWRYGSQLRWRLVLIGLSEDTARYAELGFTPLRFALGQLAFRRYGMPFALQPKERLSATARACRAVVAARLDRPGEEWRVLRALQLANFTTPLLLDDDEQLADALAGLPGCDARALISRLDDDDVTEAYRRDRAEARRAAGSAAELQGKTATDGDQVRFTAPSIVFARGAHQLVAGGFQPVEAYDVLVANLDPGLRREPVPETVAPLLARFPDGLTTQEVAALMARSNDAPDRQAAEQALLELVADGAASRQPLGDDALWQAREVRAPAASARSSAVAAPAAAEPALALVGSAEAESCSAEAACL
jgi:predicted DsbA family dithiol-disulfide isomerase